MAEQFDPSCNKDIFDKLSAGDESVWARYKETTSQRLDDDIRQSILKALRNRELLYSDGLVDSLAYEVSEKAWEKFREILTRPNSSFKWVSSDFTYNYLRKTSWSMIQRSLKKLAAEETLGFVTYSIDALAEQGEHILENFLFRHGGYNDTNIDHEIILQSRIDGLIELLEEPTINPLHRRMLLYRVIDERSSEWIANELGTTPEVVDTTLSRFRKQLRERLLVKESVKENRKPKE